MNISHEKNISVKCTQQRKIQQICEIIWFAISFIYKKKTKKKEKKRTDFFLTSGNYWKATGKPHPKMLPNERWENTNFSPTFLKSQTMQKRKEFFFEQRSRLVGSMSHADVFLGLICSPYSLRQSRTYAQTLWTESQIQKNGLILSNSLISFPVQFI